MSSKSEKTITLRKKTMPVKPRMAPSKVVSRDVQDNDDEDIVFDDEASVGSDAEVLDDYLLASRDEEIDESEEETVTLKSKLIGSKAKLRALMNHSDGSGSNDQSEVDEPSEVDDTLDSEQIEKQARKAKAIIAKQKKPVKQTNVKRGPGRPPKTQKKDPIPRKGVARSPHNPDSFVEVLYDQPIIMKKIFSFFKYVAASEIQILFRPRDIIFYAVDHNGKTKIRVRVDTDKLNHYYCKDVLDVGISQKEMEMILNKVDKDYSSIVILSDINTTRRNLTLVFENDIQIDELHRIDLIASYNKMEDEQAFINEDYMIKFNFPGRYFKKTVGDIKSMSPQLSITQEDNESPLIFEYLTINKRIQSKHTVKDSNKIKLESNLSDNESFRVDVCIDYLKPISAAQISDDITILVDENKCLMTKSYIDNKTIEIKTLTEIIDERPDDDDDD